MGLEVGLRESIHGVNLKRRNELKECTKSKVTETIFGIKSTLAQRVISQAWPLVLLCAFVKAENGRE